MGLRDIGATLPPGFRFYPSDEELVCHYLRKKIINEDALKGTLVEIDLHTCEPWQLPEVAKLNTSEWYFFSFRDRKYATGFRTNRATTCGYWKATGKDRVILDPKSKEAVGMRKTLVFYRNRAPNGIKTGWIMHEFRLESPRMPPKEDWVLCRVFNKGKVGENNNNNNGQIQYLFDHSLTSTSSPPPLVASPPSSTNNNNINIIHNNNNNNNHTIIPCECQQQQQQPNSFSSNNPPLFPQKQNFIHNIMVNSKNDPICDVSTNNNFNNLLSLNPNSFLHHIKDNNEDDYGFLWNMDNFEENGNNKFGDVGFEDDSNGAIFI